MPANFPPLGFGVHGVLKVHVQSQKSVRPATKTNFALDFNASLLRIILHPLIIYNTYLQWFPCYAVSTYIRI